MGRYAALPTTDTPDTRKIHHHRHNVAVRTPGRNTLLVCTFRAQSSAAPLLNGLTRISPGIAMTNGSSLLVPATSWPTPSSRLTQTDSLRKACGRPMPPIPVTSTSATESGRSTTAAGPTNTNFSRSPAPRNPLRTIGPVPSRWDLTSSVHGIGTAPAPNSYTTRGLAPTPTSHSWKTARTETCKGPVYRCGCGRSTPPLRSGPTARRSRFANPRHLNTRACQSATPTPHRADRVAGAQGTADVRRNRRPRQTPLHRRPDRRNLQRLTQNHLPTPRPQRVIPATFISGSACAHRRA